ncbi:hypothetical protein GCM10027425_07210 [Alteromonas gracilis]
MSAVRAVAVAGLVLLAFVLQVAVLGQAAILGVVPNLVLVVVIAVAVVRGPEYAVVTGLMAGLLLDLAPPADHLAGRWALALLLAGYLAGTVRHDVDPPLVRAGILAVGSFVATSVFALTGLALGDLSATPGQLAGVIGVSLALDVVVGLLLLPVLLPLLHRLRPARLVLD